MPGTVPVTITFTPNSPKVEVNPDTAQVHVGDQDLTWNFVGLTSGFSAHVDFQAAKGEKGPFPKSGQPNNPSRGVYESSGAAVVTTNADKKGKWKYDVAIKDSDGNVVANVDPFILVENDD